VHEDTMRELERIGGNGGLFGFFGEFKTRFGRTIFYATRLNNYVMIVTADSRKIVLTPDKMALYSDLKNAIQLVGQQSPLKMA